MSNFRVHRYISQIIFSTFVFYSYYTYITPEHITNSVIMNIGQKQCPKCKMITSSSIHDKCFCDKEIIVCSCIEGKLLPLIPIPNKTVDDYPNCTDCNGKGFIEVDKKNVLQGEIYKKYRHNRRVSLKEFCQRYELDPVKVSRVERGLEDADKSIKVAYASMITTQA